MSVTLLEYISKTRFLFHLQPLTTCSVLWNKNYKYSKFQENKKHHTVAGSNDLPKLSRTSGTLSNRYVVTNCLLQPNHACGCIYYATVFGGNSKLNLCGNFSCFLLKNVKTLLPPQVLLIYSSETLLIAWARFYVSFSSLLQGLDATDFVCSFSLLLPHFRAIWTQFVNPLVTALTVSSIGIKTTRKCNCY